MCLILIVFIIAVISYDFANVLAISSEDEKNATNVLHLDLNSSEAKVFKDKSTKGLLPEFKFYETYTYDEYIDELEKLKKSCGDIMTITPAHDIYSGELYTADYYQCGTKKCQMPIVHLSGDLQSTTLPEIYISGEVHGDERLGPAACLEFLKMACSMYKTSPVMKYLLKTRSIWITPITNALGYYSNTREENRLDPNRDFPYKNQTCMNTITARIVNELFTDHLFQLVISNHGGMRALGWQRGDPFDLVSGSKSNSHDAVAHDDIGNELTEAAGTVNATNPFDSNISAFGESVKQGEYYFYKSGLMANTVGDELATIEDWAYAASWHDDSKECTKSDLLGLKAYPLDKTTYRKEGSEIHGMRAAQFIFELDKTKGPGVALYGHSMQLTNPEMFNGFIPRILRMFLKAAEYVQPDILLLNTPSVTHIRNGIQDRSISINLRVLPVGCNKLSSLNALVYENGCNSAQIPKLVFPIITNHNCSGLELWNGWDYGINYDIPDELVKKSQVDVVFKVDMSSTTAPAFPLCIKLQATFDQHWDHLNAQTHLVKSRILNSYTAKAKNSSINATKNKVFPILNNWGSDFSKGIEIKDGTTFVDLGETLEQPKFVSNSRVIFLEWLDIKTISYNLKLTVLENIPLTNRPPFWDSVEPSENYSLKATVCLYLISDKYLRGTLSIYLYDLLPGYSHLSREPVLLKQMNLDSLSKYDECSDTILNYSYKEIDKKVESGVNYVSLTSVIHSVNNTITARIAPVNFPVKKLSGYQSASSMSCIFYEDNKFANIDIKEEDLNKPDQHMKIIEKHLKKESIGYIVFENIEHKNFTGVFCPSTKIDPKEKTLLVEGSCKEINQILSLEESKTGNGFVFSGKLSNAMCSEKLEEDTQNGPKTPEIKIILSSDTEKFTLAKCSLQANVVDIEHISGICAANAVIKTSLLGFILAAIIAFLTVF